MAKKNIIGICHICGVHGKLSYEHIPPSKAFNNTAATVYKGIDVLTSNELPWELDGVEKKKLQRGIGGYTLCSKCNSFTGTKYANEFIKVCRQTKSDGNLQVYEDLLHARITLKNIRVFRFVKQVLAMFASINGPEFFEKNQELRALVLDENRTRINTNKYAIFMYLYKGGTGRNAGLSGALNFETGKNIISTEFTTTPFGFIMILDPDRNSLPDYGAEITEVLNTVGYNDKCDLVLEVPILEQNTPIPLDFRTQEDITMTKNDNSVDQS